MENNFHNLKYCSSLQPIVIYNISEFEGTFSALIWDYMTNCWYLCGTVSVSDSASLIRSYVRFFILTGYK